MAGSRRWFGYRDDQGQQWAVELDESNYESAQLGFDQQVDQATIDAGRILQATAGRPLAMRYVNATRFNAGGEAERRRFYVGNTNANAWTTSAFLVGLTNWSKTSSGGERVKGIPAVDTGLTDGDADANVADPA